MLLSSSSTPSVELKHASDNLLVFCKPLSVNLIRLSKSEIEKYQHTNTKVKSSQTSSVQSCTVKIWKLPLGRDQHVQLKQFSQSDRGEKSVLQKPIQKLTPIHCKCFAKHFK